MAVFLLNHYDLFSGDTTAEKSKIYMPLVLDYLAHIKNNSSDAELLNQTKKMQAYCYLILQEPDKVLEIAGTFIENYLPSDDLIAAAYQLKGELGKAITTSQSGLLQNVIVLLSSLTNYLQLSVGMPEKFAETFVRGTDLVESFNLEAVNPAAVVNFYTSAASGFASLNEETQTIHLVEKVVQLMGHAANFKISPDNYFDAITPWLDHSVRGGETPRADTEIKASLTDFILHYPALEPFKNNTKLRAIREQLKKEEPNHE